MRARRYTQETEERGETEKSKKKSAYLEQGCGRRWESTRCTRMRLSHRSGDSSPCPGNEWNGVHAIVHKIRISFARATTPLEFCRAFGRSRASEGGYQSINILSVYRRAGSLLWNIDTLISLCYAAVPLLAAFSNAFMLLFPFIAPY